MNYCYIPYVSLSIISIANIGRITRNAFGTRVGDFYMVFNVNDSKVRRVYIQFPLIVKTDCQ